MTLYFGLNVNRNLTDISDNEEALRNLNLDIKDLDVIRGVTDPGGVTTEDFRSLSNLDFDYEKTVIAQFSETDLYNLLTTNFYDESSYIDSNITINGQLGGTAIKYLYVDQTTKTIKTAEISTSRVSSWSSFASPIVPTSPIFYGGEVICEGPIELSSLDINSGAIPNRFESEIPTHKIKTTINGETVWLYAMKGIPLRFRGFFQRANIGAGIQSIIVNGNRLRPSWVIKNVDSPTEYEYKNRLSGTTSALTFNDTSAKARDIDFYYPVDNITALSLPTIGLVELPPVNLTNLNTLDISSNDFREMPNLTGYTNLANLNISSNNLSRSGVESLKTLSQHVVSRLPSNLVSFVGGNCYSGPCTADFSALSNLKILNLNSDQRFLRLTGTSPEVPSTIERYSIIYNLFSVIANSVQESESLIELNISHNNVTATNLTIASEVLETFESYYNFHNVVNVSNKPFLKSYNARATVINGESSATNAFTQCSSLETVTYNDSPITGPIPQFEGCTSLKYVDFYNTTLSSSEPDKVLTDDTFNSCRSTLQFFRVVSNKLSGQFSENCIGFMPSLTFFWVESRKNANAISGPIPNFSGARNINYILLFNNNLEGTIPNFDSNRSLYYLHLYNNKLTGAVPNIKASNFSYLIVCYNKLTTFNEIESTSLYYADLSFNELTSIPNLSNLERLRFLYLNNQKPASGRVSYTPGSFVGLKSIAQLNLANNFITQGSIDQIIKDLSANYDASPRGGVSVNLSGNTAPSATDEITNSLRKLRNAGWTIRTD